MQRVAEWSNALVLWAREEIGKPYIWGETDCGSLVRRGLAVVYGAPIGNVPPYDSLAEAMRVYADVDGVLGVLMRLGGEAIGLKFATTGDIVLAESPFGSIDVASLCLGPTILSSDPESGVVVVPRPREGPFVAYRLPHELPDG